MTENIAKKSLISLLPKDTIENKDYLNNLYYDKDGYIISCNNHVLGAIKCAFDIKKNNTSESKDGKKTDTKYPMWGHLFRGKSFNSVDIDYEKIDQIIDICKEKMKKLPKSKYKLTPQGCEMIKFNNVYFRITHFEKFIKIAKSIKAKELTYGGSDDRMMAVSKDGKVVITPIIWYDKENLNEEPIDYLTWMSDIKKDNKQTKIKKSSKNAKK